MTDKSGAGYPGQQGLNDNVGEFNQHSFLIWQILARVRTCVPVEVMAVDGGGNAPVGFVDARPLVNQMDGGGNTFPHGTIFNLPYVRIQGGANAVIIDPVVGDKGLAMICDRDISSVKANRGRANPGSRRRFGLADGVYIGGILNAKPTCWIAFVDGKIEMSPDDGTTSLTIEAGKITLNAAEIISHATSKNVWDAGGTGFVYTPGAIDTYTDGITPSHHAPSPPEVPT